ncbi:MAG: hypothetical protein JW751_10170 [Polyangiaceae bacterium]|nr:hypothetical protein [Polyangiaceae bacterium]
MPTDPESGDSDHNGIDVDLVFPKLPPETEPEAAATDLDIGSVVDLLPEDAQPDGEDLPLDLVSLLAKTDEDGTDDDDAGPIALDPTSGITIGPELLGGEEDEADAGYDDLAAEPLPNLGADDEGWNDPADPPLLGLVGDEPPPPPSENPWRWEPMATHSARCPSIAVGTDIVATGGHGLSWLEAPHGTAVRVASHVHLVSVALVGPVPTLALAVTTGGELLRIARDGLVTPCEVRHVLEPRDWAARLELHTLTSGVTSSVLARTSSGTLLRSEDGGRRFAVIDLGGPVIALGTGIDAPLALVRSAAGLSLARGSHDGATWVRRPLPPTAAGVADGDAPLVAGVDSCVLLARVGYGVAMSTDGGATYRQIPGLATATTLAVGRLGGRPAAWFALYSETHDTTDLVLLDLDREEATRVARIEPTDPDDASADVAALAWDDSAGRLWAVGGFGVGTFSPPRQ